MSQWDADGLYIYNTNETVTISGGVATITKGRVILAAESGTADQLDSISLNYGSGIPSRAYLVLLSADTGDTITVAINGSNIKSGGSASSVTLTGNTVMVGMVYNNVLTLLNADFPSSAVDWTRPGTIGSVTPNTGAFTTLAASGNFAIATNKFTVTAASGNTLVAGTLSVTGDVAVNTNKFTVTAASGNTVVAGTLGVTLGATFSSTVSAIADTTDLYRVTMSQNVGTNTIHTITGTTAPNAGNTFITNVSGTITGTGTHIGSRFNPTITPTAGIAVARGVSVNPTLTGSQNVTTRFSGFVSTFTVNTSGGTVTEATGIYIPAPTFTAGTVTTAQSLLIEPPTGAGTNYAAYVTAGISSFADAIEIREISSTPATPTASTNWRMYAKADKLIFLFNDGGTAKYFYKDGTSTDGLWTYTTSAP